MLAGSVLSQHFALPVCTHTLHALCWTLVSMFCLYESSHCIDIDNKQVYLLLQRQARSRRGTRLNIFFPFTPGHYLLFSHSLALHGLVTGWRFQGLVMNTKIEKKKIFSLKWTVNWVILASLGGPRKKPHVYTEGDRVDGVGFDVGVWIQEQYWIDKMMYYRHVLKRSLLWGECYWEEIRQRFERNTGAKGECGLPVGKRNHPKWRP